MHRTQSPFSFFTTSAIERHVSAIKRATERNESTASISAGRRSTGRHQASGMWATPIAGDGSRK
jgi:hypothetical protein